MDGALSGVFPRPFPDPESLAYALSVALWQADVTPSAQNSFTQRARELAGRRPAGAPPLFVHPLPRADARGDDRIIPCGDYPGGTTAICGRAHASYAIVLATMSTKDPVATNDREWGAGHETCHLWGSGRYCPGHLRVEYGRRSRAGRGRARIGRSEPDMVGDGGLEPPTFWV